MLGVAIQCQLSSHHPVYERGLIVAISIVILLTDALKSSVCLRDISYFACVDSTQNHLITSTKSYYIHLITML